MTEEEYDKFIKFQSTHPHRVRLNLACRKFSINMKEAEKRYGLYDGREWIELLELN